MAFRKKYDYLKKWKGDLIIVQECENKEKIINDLTDLSYDQFLWFGENKNKGIGLISFNKYSIKLNPKYNPDFQYVIPFQCHISKKKVNLFAIWAMPHKIRARSYVGQVWHAIQYYESELNETSILIGDFNSHVMWDKKRPAGNHSGVVDFLASRNIFSVYHQVNKIKAGDEKDPTWFMYKNKSKPYHLDYCFASETLLDKCKIEVGAFDDWIAVSDHMPLCIDLKI